MKKAFCSMRWAIALVILIVFTGLTGFTHKGLASQLTNDPEVVLPKTSNPTLASPIISDPMLASPIQFQMPHTLTDPKQNDDTTKKTTFLRPSVWGMEYLRNMAAKWALGESIVISLIGDSWTDGVHSIYNPLREAIGKTQKVSSPGYTSANTQLFPPAGIIRKRAGLWINTRIKYGKGPDAAQAMSYGAGAILFLATKNMGEHKYRVHYLQKPNGGVFAIESGSPKRIVNTDGPYEYSVIEVTGLNTVKLVTSSANVIIFGIDVLADQKASFVINKLGNGGAGAARFNRIPESMFSKSHQELQTDLAIIILGINDKAYGIPPEMFKNQVENIARRVLKARPRSDILLIGAGPSKNGSRYSTASYNNELFQLALQNRWGFIDLHRFLGSLSEVTERGLYHDQYHPNIEGGKIIGKIIYNYAFRPLLE